MRGGIGAVRNIHSEDKLIQYIIDDEGSLQDSKFACEYRATRREELTELQRYTLCAYYFHQQSLTRIARDRGVNKSTVCRTLHRAEEKLKRFLRY